MKHVICAGMALCLMGCVAITAGADHEEVLVGFGMNFSSSEVDDSKEEIIKETNEATRPYSLLSAEKPDIDITSWEYVLVNSKNPIGEYAPSAVELEGIPLDDRIIDAMTEFVSDARAAGVSVYLSSGYRDYDTQKYLNDYQQQLGYSKEEADTIVAPAGTSEHQTGLACDITDYYREFKNEELEYTDTYQWMSQHCQEYGFIVRYPKDKEDITGIIYEPWHYRYVGVEAATFIMEHNLCLEEFVELYS